MMTIGFRWVVGHWYQDFIKKKTYPKNYKIILIYHWVHRLSWPHGTITQMWCCNFAGGDIRRIWGLFITGICLLQKHNFSSNLFGCRISVSFKHCISDWPDWWLQESSSWASIITSNTSNLLTQKICGWHNWFLCKIHSAFILCLTSTYKVQQTQFLYLCVRETWPFIKGIYPEVRCWKKSTVWLRTIHWSNWAY